LFGNRFFTVIKIRNKTNESEMWVTLFLIDIPFS